eukprot:362732-Chlamydomonas_euryale.AAC.4
MHVSEPAAMRRNAPAHCSANPLTPSRRAFQDTGRMRGACTYDCLDGVAAPQDALSPHSPSVCPITSCTVCAA